MPIYFCYGTYVDYVVKACCKCAGKPAESVSQMGSRNGCFVAEGQKKMVISLQKTK